MRLRKQAGTVVTAALTAAIVASAPAAAGAIVAMARNSDKVDGKHAVGARASVRARRGKLVATGRTGRLPNNIISRAPDAARLGGKAASKYALRDHLSVPATINHGTNPVHWTRLKGVPDGLADGSDDLGPRAYGRVGSAGFVGHGVDNFEVAGGSHCFELPFDPRVVLVTPDLLNSRDLRTADASPYASVHGETIAEAGCPAGVDDAVVTFRTSANDVRTGPFFVAFS